MLKGAIKKLRSFLSRIFNGNEVLYNGIKFRVQVSSGEGGSSVDVSTDISTALTLHLHPKFPGEGLLSGVLKKLKFASPLKMKNETFDSMVAAYSSRVEDSLRYLDIEAVETAIICLFAKGYAISINNSEMESNKLYATKAYYDANDLKKELLEAVFEDISVLIKNLPRTIESPVEKLLSCPLCGKTYDKSWKICLRDNAPLKEVL